MTLLWAGDVALPAIDGGTEDVILNDVQFHKPPGVSGENELHILPHNAYLRFLAFIETTRLPLCLTYGPRLDVCTQDADTEEHIWKMLVASSCAEVQPLVDSGSGCPLSGAQNLQQCIDGRFESDLGMLFHVEDGSGPVSKILFYAASEPRYSNGSGVSGLMTPPRSSSPVPDEVVHPSSSLIRVYAQLLRSFDSIAALCQTPPPPSSPSCMRKNNGMFFSHSESSPHFSPLEPSNHIHTAEHSEAPPRKRPRIDVFSAAHSAYQRTQRRGGKSVAHLMASGATGSRTPGTLPGLARAHTTGSLSANRNALGEPASRPGSRHESPPLSRPESRGASRPGTSGSGSMNASSHAAASISRPVSRHHSRHTSLHRVTSLSMEIMRGTPEGDAIFASTLDTESVLDPHPPPLSAPLPSASTQPASAAEASIEATNKTALSRVVLAALRMWGYSGTQQPEGSEEDFKALYHATYSAAKFALRHENVKQIVLGQEVMRSAAERVLEMFLG